MGENKENGENYKIRAVYFAAFINRKDENTVNTFGFVPEKNNRIENRDVAVKNNVLPYSYAL